MKIDKERLKLIGIVAVDFFLLLAIIVGCVALSATSGRDTNKPEPEPITIIAPPQKFAVEIEPEPEPEPEPRVLSDDENPDIYWGEIVAGVKSAGHNISFGYYNFATDTLYVYDGSRIFYGASLVKVVDALYVYENMDITDELRSLVRKAIVVSDNDAHMELYKIIGRQNMQAYGRNIGMEHFLDTADSLEYGYTTVDDQIALWKKVYSFIYDDYGTDQQELEKFLIDSLNNEISQASGVPALHKYGYWEEWYHNSSIVRADSPYILTVLTKEGWSSGRSVIGDLAQKIYKLNELVVNANQ